MRKPVSVLAALLALALILAQHASVSAQKNRPMGPPPNPPPPDQKQVKPIPNARSVEQATLEMTVLLSGRSLEADVERERRRMAAQLSQDLERLKEINRLKLASMSAARSLDYKSLAQATAEIRERAARIKYNVRLDLKDKKGEKIRYEEDAGKLPAMLPELSRVIVRLIESPIFRIASPNDAELRREAGANLEAIIKLSETINKVAKRLSKPIVASR